MNKDSKLFNDVSFSNILEKIYTNATNRSGKIQNLIDVLQPLVSDIKDATLIVPLIKEYLEIDVRNDDNLVKISAIIQRLIKESNADSNDDGLLTPEEWQQLINNTKEIEDKTDNEVKELEQKAEDIVDKYKKDSE